jgi:hypothetical protein
MKSTSQFSYLENFSVKPAGQDNSSHDAFTKLNKENIPPNDIQARRQFGMDINNLPTRLAASKDPMYKKTNSIIESNTNYPLQPNLGIQRAHT